MEYLIDWIAGEETRVSVVSGVGDVEAAEDFDGGVLSKYRIVDSILGPRLSKVLGATLATPQVVALLIAQRRLFQKSQFKSIQTSIQTSIQFELGPTSSQPPFRRHKRMLHW